MLLKRGFWTRWSFAGQRHLRNEGVVGEAIVRQFESLAEAQAASMIIALRQQDLTRHQQPRRPADVPHKDLPFLFEPRTIEETLKGLVGSVMLS